MTEQELATLLAAERERCAEAVKHIPPCPFDRATKYKPEEPCPVCGDLGTFPRDGDPPSRCQSAYAAIRALGPAPTPPPPRDEVKDALAAFFSAWWGDDNSTMPTAGEVAAAARSLGLTFWSPTKSTQLSDLGKRTIESIRENAEEPDTKSHSAPSDITVLARLLWAISHDSPRITPAERAVLERIAGRRE